VTRGALACAGVVVGALILGGATVPELTVEELATRADVVVRVRVESSDARWVAASRHDRIVTFHEVRPLQLVAGALVEGERAAGTMLVGTLGGWVGDIEQRVPGAPRLVVGEEYLLFLGLPAGPGGARGVVGMWRGAVRAGPALPAAQKSALLQVLERVAAVRP
jgi:hypothetical protein